MSSSMTRRRLLTVPVALGASALVPGAFAASLAAESRPLPDLSDW